MIIIQIGMTIWVLFYHIYLPKQIFNTLKQSIFKKPIFINVHTKRLYWHAGAGKDEKIQADRLSIEMKRLGKKAVEINKKIKNRIEKLWQKRLEKQ